MCNGMKEKIEESSSTMLQNNLLQSSSSPLQNSLLQSSMLQDSRLQNDQQNIRQQNVPQVRTLKQHIQDLKNEQILLQQAHEEYSPYNVEDQIAKYIHPRLEEKKRWDRGKVLQVKRLSVADMVQAYSMTGFKLTDSAEKRSMMYFDAIDRYKLQTKFKKRTEFVAQNDQMDKKNLGYVNCSMKDAMKLSYEEIADNYGAQYTDPDVAKYIEIRCNLMKNPFFSIMPVDELKKTPRRELLEKLDKEYSRNDAKRGAIVALYEDLIKLQLLEKQANAVERKKPQNPPVAITQKEVKNNKSYNTKIDNAIDSYNHLTEEVKEARKKAVRSVMTEGDLWADREPADMNGVSAAQTEGARAILAWMYQNCGAGKEGSKEAFVYTLTRAKPKQLLFMLYLVENGMSASPDSECFDNALKNYIPDPNAKVFKKKPNWTAISQAEVFVRNCEEFNVFLECEKEEQAISKTLEKYDDLEDEGQEPPEEKTEALGRMAAVLVRKLAAMYNAAGLSPDMPVDLISDPTLKQHVNFTIEEFKRLGQQLQAVLNRNGEGAGADPIETKKSSESDKKKKFADEISSYVKAGQEIPKSFIKILGSDVAEFSKALPYAIATGGLSAIFGLYGLISKAIDLRNFKTDGLKGVEILSKRMDLSGGILKGGGDIIKGATDIYKQAVGFNPNNYTTFKELFSTGAGRLQLAAGTISIVAGGLQTGSGMIDMKQASNSQKHLNNAKAHLNNKKSQDKRNDEGRLEEEELSEDQIRQRELRKKQKELQRKEIKSLITHRETVTKNKKNSAMVNMAGGILTMAGGALTMTGLLAPLGGLLSIAGSAISIGLGMINARIERNWAIMDAVDAGLKLPDAVRLVISRFKLKPTSDELLQLIDRVRQEALAELHYANYKVCYLDMCKKSASLLYNKVMIKPTREGMQDYTKTEEYKMYYETLKSLNFKEIKRAKYPFQTNFPTAELIYKKLTEGVA